MNTLNFPESDKWGLVVPQADPLAKKEHLRATDLKGLPLVPVLETKLYIAWNRNLYLYTYCRTVP